MATYDPSQPTSGSDSDAPMQQAASQQSPSQQSPSQQSASQQSPSQQSPSQQSPSLQSTSQQAPSQQSTSQQDALPSSYPVHDTKAPLTNGEAHNCIEREINEISRHLAMADRLKEYKASLEALLQKTRSAMDDYTVQKYALLLKRWKDQDVAIADLVKKLSCTVSDVEGTFRNSVCPLFQAIVTLQNTLDPAQGESPQEPERKAGLYRLRDWQQREYDRLRLDYEYWKTVLAAWEKPTQTIDKVMNENAKILTDTYKSVGQADAAVLLADVFLKLLPMHWLIRPPGFEPCLDPRHYLHCDCDDAAWELLCEALGPQPMLIEPAAYLPEICNNALKHYNCVKNAYADADGNLKKTLEEIKRAEKALDDKKKSLEKDAKAALLSAALKEPDNPPPTTGKTEEVPVQQAASVFEAMAQQIAL